MDENMMANEMATGGIMAFLAAYFIFIIAIYLFYSFCLFRIYKKAGKENAWAAFIPIYSDIVFMEVIGKPIWWVIVMYLVPCVNIYFLVVSRIELGKRFGKDAAWSIFLLILFAIVGLPMLAFGSDQYTPPPPGENSANA